MQIFEYKNPKYNYKPFYYLAREHNLDIIVYSEDENWHIGDKIKFTENINTIPLDHNKLDTITKLTILDYL